MSQEFDLQFAEDQIKELILQSESLLRQLGLTYEDREKILSSGKGETKSRNWTFIMYFDSAPKRWMELIDNWNIKCLVSPVHNLDVLDNGTGELVKPHRHVMVHFDGPTPYSRVLELVKPLGCKTCFPVKSVEGMERYFCHIGKRNKAQYDVEELLPFGGYVVQFLKEQFENTTGVNILEYAERIGIVNFADLSRQVYTKFGIEEHALLMRHQGFYNNWCSARQELKKYNKATHKIYYQSYEESRCEGIGAGNDY